MNKLYQQLNQGQRNSLPNNIRQLISRFKMMNNPQSAVQQMLNQNPQLQNIIKIANGNPEQAFKNMCKQYNVNPEEIMNMLK